MKELNMYKPPAAPDKPMLDVAVGPHYRLGSGLAEIYQRWVIALLPAMAASIYYFGLPSLRVFGLCVLFAVVIDLVAETVAPSRDLTSNWSSVSLAMFLAFMMPLNAPWWLIFIGCFLMIVIGKKFFGGVGAYPAQPAVLALAILSISWPNRMDHTGALKDLDWPVTMVEPLRLLKSIGATAENHYHWVDLFFGRQVAGTAEGMVLFILVGGLFLIALREIQWQLPTGFAIGVLGTSFLLHLSDPATFASPLFYLLSGGTMFAGFFLLTDHTTSPVNKLSMFLYGLLAGVLLILIRGYSKHADGLLFAILLANLCAPLLDIIKPKVKGVKHV